MYNAEPPERLRVASLEALDACPASAFPGSRLPRATLDRWLAVHDALDAALSYGVAVERAVEDNAAWLDPIQRSIVADLVANGVSALGDSHAQIEFNPGDSPVVLPHPSLDAEYTSYFQIVVTSALDPSHVERFRIKTGRVGTSELEAAVLIEGDDVGATYADLMLSAGTIEPIELTGPELAVALERLYRLADSPRNRRDRTPGWVCYLCDRVARCGQYPTAIGITVGARQRTLRLSKSDVLEVDRCHRAVAWKVLHSIPKEIGDEAGPAVVTGLMFHEILAEVLLAVDQGAAFDRLLEQVSPDDRPVMRDLYSRHQQIESSHVPVRYGRTEYQVGATLVLEGLDSDRDGNVRDGAAVAVAVIARTDAVGREPDNTPAVIEHRTGKTSDRIDERETAMYALSTARLLGVDTVAVHQHSLGTDGDPECIRIVYDADALTRAEELLERVLAPVAGWDPIDACEPSYSVGEWCTRCPYAQRCSRFRD
jgi:hypothetical protein